MSFDIEGEEPITAQVDRLVVEEFARALLAAKASASNEGQFWESKALSDTYRNVERHFCRSVASDVIGIEHEIFTKLGLIAWDVWEQDQWSFDSLCARITNAIEVILQVGALNNFLAIIPLESGLRSLPTTCDLGPLHILNARPEIPRGHWGQWLIHTIAQLYPEHKDALMECRSRHAELLEHHATNKYGMNPNYRPPVLVFSLRRGGEHANREYAIDLAARNLGLIDFAHALTSIMDSGRLKARKASIGRHHYGKYVFGSLLNSFSPEDIDLFGLPSSCTRLDYTRTSPVDVSAFLENWEKYVAPIQRVISSELHKDASQKLQDVTQLIGRCRHVDFSDLQLYSVICSETLLNLLDDNREHLSERIALFGAALLSNEPANRMCIYKDLKHLYVSRSRFVHAATRPIDFRRNRFDGEPASDILQSLDTRLTADRLAFDYFLKILEHILEWLLPYVDQSPKPTKSQLQSAFHSLYLDSLLGKHSGAKHS